MHYPNAAVTDEGHATLVRAMRHEWEDDDLDDAARAEIMALAEGRLTMPGL